MHDMALSIRSRSVEEKARKLAAIRGISITAAIELALDSGLARHEQELTERSAKFRQLVRDIQADLANAPVLDERSIDEILYDEDGLPK
jgi:hypothetical protein